MNNMQKAFKAKSGLRCMADGGIFKNIVNGVQTFTDAKAATAGAEAYTPRAMRELPNAGITPGAVAPMPAPAKLSVAPTPVIQPAAASPLPAPAAAPAQRFRPQDPYEKAAGKDPIAITPRRIPMDYMTQTGGFGPTIAPPQPGAIGANRAEIGANRRPIGGVGAMGMPLMTSVGYASGGEVKGPGGPTDDEVGPVMLSDGEYVLPADTVEKVGKENLDALKDATHVPVRVKQRRGLRKMADGTMTEEEKRRQLNPAVAMLEAGVPNQQPMPSQRPSEALSGRTDVGVMRGLQGATEVVRPPLPVAATARSFGSAANSFMRPHATIAEDAKPVASPVEMASDVGNAALRAVLAPQALSAVSPTAAPAAPPAPSTPVVEKLAPPEKRGEDGKFPGFEGAVASGVAVPFTPRGLTSAQSGELERLGVGLGAQMNPVMPLSRSDAPVQPAVPLSAQTDFNPDLVKGPRAFRSDTIREGVTPGEQVNLGNGIFATTDPTNGDKRLNSFTGVGADFSADSARFGPDPNGADRARQDAMVERNLQAKPREVSAPQLRSDERGINSQFDKLAEAARKNFASPRAAGNLNKALERIVAQRTSALAQNADNMTRQQQIQSSSAATDRELSSREAQAARADETDRLTIASQDQRAAGAAAQTSALADREFERKNYEVAVKNKQFSGTYNDWVAYGGSRKQGGGQPYVNVKDVERNTKRVTDRVAQMFPEDPAAQANVVANARLFWGAPDAAVAAYAPVVNSIAQKLGRPDIGLPQLSDDGKETWDASAADLQKGSDNWWTDARASLWDGDGPAYKFVTDGGEEIFIAKSRLSAPEQRFLQSYLQSSKPKKERD